MYDELFLKRLHTALLAEMMPRAVRRLCETEGGAEGIWEMSEAVIGACHFLSEEEKAELISAKKRGLPAETAGKMAAGGIKAVCIEEEAYPERLRECTDAPYMIFYKGRMPAEEEKRVAVIGARNCSDYGRRMAEYFGRELAVAGVSIISGMARGIDGMAQEACVKAGGRSYALLGSGVDVIYPRSNAGLYEKLQERGGVISEYPPGREALAFHFPLRNRLISAFCDILLVVEAREKSGTFITVNYALEQGREVYAVPGRIEDKLSFGSNRLIAQGVGVAYCVEELLLALKDTERQRKLPDVTQRTEAKPVKPDNEGWEGSIRRGVRRVLYDSPATAQEIYGRIGMPKMKIQELLAELMKLEIEGRVICRAGVYELK